TGAAMSIAMSYFKAAIDHMIDVPLPEPRQIKFDSDQMAQTGTVDTYENHSEADESSLDDLDWAPKIPPKPTPTKRSRADTTPNFDPVFALLGIPTGDTTPWIDDQGRPQLIDIEGSRIHNEPKFKPASFKHSGPELAIEFPEE
ncbi:hypothetical protein EBR96_02255, partial [bacterium]|nr:hypothetical protein [bacterium]